MQRGVAAGGFRMDVRAAGPDQRSPPPRRPRASAAACCSSAVRRAGCPRRPGYQKPRIAGGFPAETAQCSGVFPRACFSRALTSAPASDQQFEQLRRRLPVPLRPESRPPSAAACCVIAVPRVDVRAPGDLRLDPLGGRSLNPA